MRKLLVVALLAAGPLCASGADDGFGMGDFYLLRSGSVAVFPTHPKDENFRRSDPRQKAEKLDSFAARQTWRNKRRELTATDWRAMGRKSYKNENYALAVDEFSKALRLGGPDENIYYQLGQAYSRLGLHRDAGLSFFSAYKRSGKPAFLYMSARSSYTGGEPREAVEKLNILHDRHGGSRSTWTLLGSSYLSLDRQEDAEECFVNARESLVPFDVQAKAMLPGNPQRLQEIEALSETRPFSMTPLKKAAEDAAYPHFSEMYPSIAPRQGDSAIFLERLEKNDRHNLLPLEDSYDLSRHAPPAAKRLPATNPASLPADLSEILPAYRSGPSAAPEKSNP